MQYYIVSIPSTGGNALLDEYNKFLRTHRVTRVDKHYNESTSAWEFLVEYIEGSVLEDPQVRRTSSSSTRRDVRAELPEALHTRFDLLKKIRYSIFQQRKLPAAYHVFSDKELKILTETQPLNMENIGTLSGIQVERVNLYGQYFTDDAVEKFMADNNLNSET